MFSVLGVAGIEEPNEGLIGGLFGVLLPPVTEVALSKLLLWSGSPTAGEAVVPSFTVLLTSLGLRLKIFPKRKGDGDRRSRADLASAVGGRLLPRTPFSAVGTVLPTSLAFSRQGDLPRPPPSDSLGGGFSFDDTGGDPLNDPEIVSTEGMFRDSR